MWKVGLEDCKSSVAGVLEPPAGSHLALSLRQARQARDVLGRFAPLGMRVLMLVLAASDMLVEKETARMASTKCGRMSSQSTCSIGSVVMLETFAECVVI